MKFFNTAGPTRDDDHYIIPVDDRIDVDQIMQLIAQKKYFVLHAPRQSGKTTSLLAIMKMLNESGKYKCLYINVEAAQAGRENVEEVNRSILSTLERSEKIYLKEDIIAKNRENVLNSGITNSLANIMTSWTMESFLPTVLFIDEIDSLVGDSLISVLRQLRSGYADRPESFPQSVILCGVRDVRDYRIRGSKEKDIITGGSCFNIKAKSLRIGNFTFMDLENLYLQHTTETGQKFTDGAIKLAYELTGGQPWLVNALAYEVCYELKEGKNRKNEITEELIQIAKENIIKSRVTHIDQLIDKLNEDRVKKVIAPIVEGAEIGEIPQDDLQYCIDLGLVVSNGGKIEIANKIYQEVIPRELAYITQISLGSIFEPQWFVNEDGSLNVEKLIADFQHFFRENSQSWVERFSYKEAGPQLLLQAYLQRVINGGGRIFREYGLGRDRTELMVEWNDKKRFVLELKILRKSIEKTIEDGLEQTYKYMDKTASDVGHLLIFDRKEDKTWDEKVFREEKEYNGKKIIVWGM